MLYSPGFGHVVHKVMMFEAVVKTGRPRSGIVGWMKRHPDILDHLTEHQIAARRLTALPLDLLPVEGHLLAVASAISATHRLLTNDAIIIGSMQRAGIMHLATNDDDFDRVPGITVWKPRQQ